MIKETVVVMTILGCGNEVSQCDYVATPNETWESVAACDAAATSHLTRYADAAYPVLTAKCEVQQPTAVASKSQVLPQKSVFDELRQKAETVDLDFMGKAKSSLQRIVETPKKVFVKFKTALANQ